VIKKTLTRRRITGGADVSPGKSYVVHRPDGRNAAVTWNILNFSAAYTAEVTHGTFQQAAQPQKLPISIGDLDPHVTHGFLDLPELPTKMVSQSVFAGLTDMTNRQTDRHKHTD